MSYCTNLFGRPALLEKMFFVCYKSRDGGCRKLFALNSTQPSRATRSVTTERKTWLLPSYCFFSSFPQVARATHSHVTGRYNGVSVNHAIALQTFAATITFLCRLQTRKTLHVVA